MSAGAGAAAACLVVVDLDLRGGSVLPNLRLRNCGRRVGHICVGCGTMRHPASRAVWKAEAGGGGGPGWQDGMGAWQHPGTDSCKPQGTGPGHHRALRRQQSLRVCGSA